MSFLIGQAIVRGSEGREEIAKRDLAALLLARMRHSLAEAFRVFGVFRGLDSLLRH
jgi:hypothetical protein